MLSIKLETEVSTREPDVDAGLVSWWTVTVTREDPEAPSRRFEIGRLRVAVIHAGLAMNLGDSIEEALDADSAELARVHLAFFDGASLREEFENACGGDLLYVAEFELAELWRRRNADLAVLDRVVDVLAPGCDIVVLNEQEVDAYPRWAHIGFDVVERESANFLVRDQSLQHGRAAEADDDRFEIRKPAKHTADEFDG